MFFYNNGIIQESLCHEQDNLLVLQNGNAMTTVLKREG